MEINEKIKALREDYDLTQNDIAKILGTSYQYYQKYEKGKHPIIIDLKKRHQALFFLSFWTIQIQ